MDGEGGADRAAEVARAAVSVGYGEDGGGVIVAGVEGVVDGVLIGQARALVRTAAD
jgi:hypothetical protein